MELATVFTSFGVLVEIDKGVDFATPLLTLFSAVFLPTAINLSHPAPLWKK